MSYNISIYNNRRNTQFSFPAKRTKENWQGQRKRYECSMQIHFSVKGFEDLFLLSRWLKKKLSHAVRVIPHLSRHPPWQAWKGWTLCLYWPSTRTSSVKCLAACSSSPGRWPSLCRWSLLKREEKKNEAAAWKNTDSALWRLLQEEVWRNWFLTLVAFPDTHLTRLSPGLLGKIVSGSAFRCHLLKSCNLQQNRTNRPRRFCDAVIANSMTLNIQVFTQIVKQN